MTRGWLVLRITIVNINPGIYSDYLVRADVNGKILKEWKVEDHLRSDGWKELLRKVANEAGA